jgi:GMP synthase-like glutamine amidotransferase
MPYPKSGPAWSFVGSARTTSGRRRDKLARTLSIHDSSSMSGSRLVGAEHGRGGSRWAVIQHAPYEGPGLIVLEAQRRGIGLDVCHPYRGDQLPARDVVDKIDRVGRFDGLVVMGGPMGVGDVAHPYLADELALLAAAVAVGMPVLGICLGAQLLAAALGGRVYRGVRAEIGTGFVSLTRDGRSDPVLGAAGVDELPVVHWHQDTFDLPAGAVCLASSGLYPNQAFRAGSPGGHAYGLQFHVEVDHELAGDWRPRLPNGTVIDESSRAEAERVGRRVIGAFFDSVPPGGFKPSP